MRANERVSPKGPTVNAANSNRWRVILLDWQFKIEKFLHVRKIWILFCILYDARTQYFSRTLDIDAWTIDRQEVYSFQVS